MTEMLDMMFAEIAQALGFTAWWETEGIWDEVAVLFVEAGFPADEVDDFFAEMGEDL